LAFGDSITAGTTAPALTLSYKMSAGLPQSYPFKLQALLRARYTAQTIELSNEGLPGEAAADGVRRLPGLLRALAPEVVILLHGVNDVTFQGLGGVARTAGTSIAWLAKPGCRDPRSSSARCCGTGRGVSAPPTRP
jgi:lysophospholipase L1-like esterase